MGRSIPKMMRARVFARALGRCEMCSCKLALNNWDCDHVVEHFYTGTHDEANLRALCKPCHRAKTVANQTRIAKTRRMAGEAGQQARRARRDRSLWKSRGFDKGLTKKMDGSVVKRKGPPKRPLS